MIIDKKTQKYDRQLRLWQASGQTALETAKVCLINGTATGCEILKDLVLPGIGSFTVVDGKIVEGSDVGNTFFLVSDSIGTNRVQAVTEFLQELNEDAKGFHFSEDPVALIENQPEYFLQFSIVITTDLPEKPLLKLADTLWNAKIPLVIVRTIGFIGYFRIVLPEHTVVETHPENVIDLRLDVPFPALEQYVNTFNFETLDSMDHAHVPYVVILLKYLKQWKQDHDGKLPSTSAERNEFKQLVQSGRRNVDEENFDEALASVWKACAATKVPHHVEEIFKNSSCDSITIESSNFWIIARAVRDFVSNEGLGLLPLAGNVPDMKADTSNYVAMQNIYRQKAKEDISAVRTRVHDILNSIGRPAEFISDDEIDSFCKHASFIQVIRYRSLQEEYITEPKKLDIGRWLQDPQANIVHYVLIRAMDRFYESHNRYPDAATYFLEDDTEEVSEEAKNEFNTLKTYVDNLLREWEITNYPEHLDNHIHEICRAGSSELANIASLLGGMVSQEVIKLVTKQYIPMNNKVIFDGVRSTSSSYIL
ncbi:NEDD8-activating enzyme E1 regulatory subunit-like protein [Rhizophagus irregularis]|uniref:NEDD8-activating enzyme E1 regulatory subunit n=1 Tax=Rhizophagus irregularis TaxID=588596 RepID=A0A2N1NSA3_9GLOM|nr:NEDD8-activating enzyme E1 regulatory subunit-like protein [Rhizophagus irregularis]